MYIRNIPLNVNSIYRLDINYIQKTLNTKYPVRKKIKKTKKEIVGH